MGCAGVGLAGALLAVLPYSGYLGGKMVHGDGVGAGHHRRRERIGEFRAGARKVGEQLRE